MSLSDNSYTNMVLPVSPLGSTNNGFGFGDNGSFWILLLFILLGGNNGWGNGYGGNGTTYVANDVQRGFDQAALTGGINGISTAMCNGFANVQQSLCNGFAGVNGAIANGFAQSEISANARQMADMQQNFSVQSALQNCCCENRASVADLKYTVATEACADRQAVSDALRDVIASNTANTQAILDKMCQQELDALKTQNANLQTQLNLANLAASQNQQTAQLMADNAAQTQYVVNRVAPYPIPSYQVASPYNIPNGCGCACGVA